MKSIRLALLIICLLQNAVYGLSFSRLGCMNRNIRTTFSRNRLNIESAIIVSYFTGLSALSLWAAKDLWQEEYKRAMTSRKKEICPTHKY